MNGRIRRISTATGLALVLLGSVSCGDLVRQGKSPSFLVIDLLEGASGAQASEFGGTLQSDVVTNIQTTDSGGNQVTVPTIFEDLGQVQLRILLKDQGNPGATAGPSALNVITVNRYHVSYRRSDGRNTPGVDVPYAFDGAVTATITNTPLQLTFTLVRIQAKMEAPLRAMQNSGGRIAISAIADVTFYGRDQAGNATSQTGSISVTFSDWGDPS